MGDSKRDLILGIAIGVAIVSTFGFFLLLLKSEGTESATNKNIANNVYLADNPTPSQPVKITPPTVSQSDHVLGNKNAKVTIIEFSDYQCTYSLSFHATMQQVMNEYSDKVRWIYRHFPLDSIHPYAIQAALAAECAGEQNKFWEYSDKLYEKQPEIKPENLEKFARELGLNISKFNECVSSEKYATKVEDDYRSGINSGVQGTPSSFINNQEVLGTESFEVIKAIIDSLL